MDEQTLLAGDAPPFSNKFLLIERRRKYLVYPGFFLLHQFTQSINNFRIVVTHFLQEGFPVQGRRNESFDYAACGFAALEDYVGFDNANTITSPI